MRQILRGRILLIVLMMGMAGCATGPRIRVDSDPTANITGYRSFGFFEPLATDKAGYSTLLTSRLKDAVQRELESRGYVYDESSSDLRVNFNVNITEKTEVRSTPGPSLGYGYYGYRGGMYGAWNGYPYDVETTNYKQGTLTIDVIDASRKALVWQGTAEGRITKKVMDNPAAAVNSTVSQVMEKFPSRNAAPPAP